MYFYYGGIATLPHRRIGELRGGAKINRCYVMCRPAGRTARYRHAAAATGPDYRQRGSRLGRLGPAWRFARQGWGGADRLGRQGVASPRSDPARRYRNRTLLHAKPALRRSWEVGQAQRAVRAPRAAGRSLRAGPLEPPVSSPQPSNR